ncbi:MAG: DUF4191 domain-containing protein [Egibacteraceae bacterium]
MSRVAMIRDRLRQIGRVFTATRAADARLVPYLAVAAVIGLTVGSLIGYFTSSVAWGVLLGMLLALTAMLGVFSRRAADVQFKAIKGQPGAAAAVLQTMRGPWEMTLGMAVTRKKDLVHLVVGRPGVVLVGEGSPARVAALLKQQRRTVARVAGDVPVHEVSVGEGKDQVPLRSLQVHLNRLPRKLKPRDVGPLHTRLEALGGQDLPLPKGPIPRNPRRMR